MPLTHILIISHSGSFLTGDIILYFINFTDKVWDQFSDKPMNNTCRYCLQTFAAPSLLVRHERKHTGEKPFVCEICSRGFARKDNLKSHQLVHFSKDFNV